MRNIDKLSLIDQIDENSDELIKIPMLGMADSLNVSVSSAICLFEVNRQFKFNR